MHIYTTCPWTMRSIIKLKGTVHYQSFLLYQRFGVHPVIYIRIERDLISCKLSIHHASLQWRRWRWSSSISWNLLLVAKSFGEMSPHHWSWIEHWKFIHIHFFIWPRSPDRVHIACYLSGFAPAEAADSQLSTAVAFADTLAARGLEVEHWGDWFGVPIIFSWTDRNITYFSHDCYANPMSYYDIIFASCRHLMKSWWLLAASLLPLSPLWFPHPLKSHSARYHRAFSESNWSAQVGGLGWSQIVAWWMNQSIHANYFKTPVGRKPLKLHQPANMNWVMMLET